MSDRKQVHLGCFDNELEASNAYHQKALAKNKEWIFNFNE